MFTRMANAVTRWSGSPMATVLAFAMVVVWAVLGPLFGFSQAWQLVINSVTTVITYLMVFVIQHTANRETLAIRLKLDELIRAVSEARDDLIRVEGESYEAMAERKREMERGVPSVGGP